tara:strand:+ start:2461 stop:3420 length:960 start_codon:yes stop_codon:yes gene_type:complete
MSYANLSILSILKAELEVKVTERTNLYLMRKNQVGANIVDDKLTVAIAVIDKEISSLILRTSSSATVGTDFNKVKPLIIFGQSSRFSPSAGPKYTTEWGSGYTEAYVHNTILKMVNSNLDKDSIPMAFKYKGIESPLTPVRLSNSDVVTILNTSDFEMSSNSKVISAADALVGLLPLKNTTDGAIEITVKFGLSLYNSNNSAVIYSYLPDQNNDNRSTISAITETQETYSTSSLEVRYLTATLDVPANTTILIAGIGHERYYTTSSSSKHFSVLDIASIYPEGIVTDIDLANNLLNEQANNKGRFDSLVELFNYEKPME